MSRRDLESTLHHEARLLVWGSWASPHAAEEAVYAVLLRTYEMGRRSRAREDAQPLIPEAVAS